MGLDDYTKKTSETGIGSSETIGANTAKGTVKQTSKAVDTDWLGSNVSPTDAPAIHRLSIRIATATVVNLQWDDGTTANIEYILNGGTALVANQLYSFDIIVPSGYSYNVQHKTTTQLVDLTIVELAVGSS